MKELSRKTVKRSTNCGGPDQAKAQWIKENLKPGEVYAGLILGKGGAPDHHLILLPGETSANFKDAETWAKNAGGSLPTRRERKNDEPRTADGARSG